MEWHVSIDSVYSMGDEKGRQESPQGLMGWFSWHTHEWIARNTVSHKIPKAVLWPPCWGSTLWLSCAHTHTTVTQTTCTHHKIVKKITNLLIFGCVLKYFILFCYSNLCVSFVSIIIHVTSWIFLKILELYRRENILIYPPTWYWRP